MEDEVLDDALEEAQEDSEFRAWVKSCGGARKAALKVGCSTASVRKYLTGDRRPSPEIAYRIEKQSDGRVMRELWYWDATQYEVPQ